MAVTIRIPTQLRELSGGASEVGDRGRDGEGAARRARRRAPGLRRPPPRRLRRSCAASSTSSWPTRTSGSSTGSTPRCADGQVVSIVPAVAGG